MATVTNIKDFKRKDLNKYKDYDVDSVIKCIIEDGDKAYNLISKIQKDKERKGIDRIW